MDDRPCKAARGGFSRRQVFEVHDVLDRGVPQCHERRVDDAVDGFVHLRESQDQQQERQHFREFLHRADCQHRIGEQPQGIAVCQRQSVVAQRCPAEGNVQCLGNSRRQQSQDEGQGQAADGLGQVPVLVIVVDAPEQDRQEHRH